MMFMRVIFATLLTVNLITYACTQQLNTEQSEAINDESVNYLDTASPLTTDGLVNAVVEIPAGTSQKWEVNKETGFLEWELIDHEHRIVNYLPYPWNYGMIPQTLLPVSEGGDGDPLDILILGPSNSRGAVIPVRVIGVLRMMDRGEQDDKLIAIDPGSHFSEVHKMNDLEVNYPGVIDIIKLWFENYKGDGHIIIQSVEDEHTADEIIRAAISSYALTN